jgi:drug/metabolite transporter (DMT)-like permease
MLLAGTVSFSLLDAITKLVSGSYPLAQAIGVRWLVVLLLFGALRAAAPGIGGPLRTAMPGLHLLRSAVMVCSAAGFFMGFRQVPLAEGYLVFFTAPFMVLALSPLLLKEKVPAAAWFWSAVGFGGVLVSVAQKLGDGGSITGYLFILLGTTCFAITQALNRMLRAEAGWARLLFWGALFGLLAYGPLAVAQWVPPSAGELALLAVAGIFASGGVVLSATAYQVSDPARLGPYGFAALPISVLLDRAIWGTMPTLATLLGGCIVVFACIMSERARRSAAAQGMEGGKTCAPSAPSGSGVTPRTAESGSAP